MVRAIRTNCMNYRTATNIPKMPSPALNHSTDLIFMGHQKKDPPDSLVPKVAETTVLLLLL